MARSEGFDSINMDLIAGLPTDTREGFSRTLDGALRLAPENITVHTLTVKRAADLTFPQARAELDLVCELDGQLAANIMYTRSWLTDRQGTRVDILTFGPLAVDPGANQ